DDFCPIPAQSYRVVKIVVIGDSVPSIFESGDTLFSSIQSTHYQWYMNDSAIAGATSNYFIPSRNAFYYLETSFQSGCTTSSPDYSFHHSSLFSLDEIARINISPNPFHHSVRVRTSGKKMESITILLRDVVGNLISQWQYKSF